MVSWSAVIGPCSMTGTVTGSARRAGVGDAEGGVVGGGGELLERLRHGRELAELLQVRRDQRGPLGRRDLDRVELLGAAPAGEPAGAGRGEVPRPVGTAARRDQVPLALV